MRAMGILAAQGGVEIVYRPTALSVIGPNDNVTHNHTGVPIGDPFPGRLLVVCVAYASPSETRNLSMNNVGGETPENIAFIGGSSRVSEAGIWVLQRDMGTTINVSLGTGAASTAVRTTAVAIYSLRGVRLPPRDVATDSRNTPAGSGFTMSAPVNVRGGDVVIATGWANDPSNNPPQASVWGGVTVDANNGALNRYGVASHEVEATETPRNITYGVQTNFGTHGALAVACFK